MPSLRILPNLEIYYFDENPGGNHSILLFHGLGANKASWLLQIPELTQAGFRVIAPDLPGFGESPYPGGGWSPAKIAGWMACLVESLSAAPAHVVGISLGGVIALQFSLDYAQFVDKLVLVNTFSHIQLAKLSQIPYFALRFVLLHTLGLPTQAKTVARRVFPKPEHEEYRKQLITQICQSDPRAYRAAMRAILTFNVQDRLQELKSPILVISGEEDSTVPLDAQKTMVTALPKAQHVIISGAGHAVTVEKAHEFNDILLEFLIHEN